MCGDSMVKRTVTDCRTCTSTLRGLIIRFASIVCSELRWMLNPKGDESRIGPEHLAASDLREFNLAVGQHDSLIVVKE